MLHVIKDGVVGDDKYIVFKRREWDVWFNWTVGEKEPPLPEVRDAVVIRTQDIFAGPALHGYAAALGIAIHVLDEGGYDVTKLQGIADYFSSRAVEADDGIRKMPD